jgi:hypothetical protein
MKTMMATFLFIVCQIKFMFVYYYTSKKIIDIINFCKVHLKSKLKILCSYKQCSVGLYRIYLSLQTHEHEALCRRENVQYFVLFFSFLCCCLFHVPLMYCTVLFSVYCLVFELNVMPFSGVGTKVTTILLQNE